MGDKGVGNYWVTTRKDFWITSVQVLHHMHIYEVLY